MPLEAIRIVKNWLKNTTTREANFDEIADKTTAFATRTNNNLKQLGLDINGSSYDFNNNGIATQSTSVVSRLAALEAVTLFTPGFQNLGLDISTTTKIKIVSAGGTNLSSTNSGYASFNSTTNAGQVVRRAITSNLEVTLTGAHWGFDTYGDLTDQILYIYLLDTGSAAVLGVGAKAERTTVTVADSDTAVGNITTVDKVLVSSSLSAELNCIVIGSVYAAFDDTGNAGGENYWTVQTGVGDVELGHRPIRLDGEFYF